LTSGTPTVYTQGPTNAGVLRCETCHDQTLGAAGAKYFFLHYHFRNGAAGMNVGLIMDKFSRFPMSPAYVLTELAAEANSMATS